MFLSKPLRAPAAADATELESHPDALKGWMTGLGSLETAPEQEKKKEEPKKEESDAGKTAETKSDPGPESGAGEVEPGKAGADGKSADRNADKSAEAEEKWPRTSKDWDSFKTKRKENEDKLRGEIAVRDTKVKELEGRLKELDERGAKLNEPPPEIKAQLDRLTKENEEMSLRLQVLDVTQHPKFEAYFKGKTDAQIALAKRVVGADLAEQVEAILKMPDIPELAEIKQSRIEEIVNELSPIQQSRIGSVLNALTEIGEERQAEIARAQEHKATLTTQQVETQKQNQEKAIKLRDTAFSEMLKAVQDNKNGMPIFQLREGDDEWNSGVGKRLDTAKRYFLGAKDITPSEIAKASFMAAALPDMLVAYQADMKAKEDDIAKLQEQVKTLSAAQPGKGGAAGGEAGGEGGLRLSSSAGPQEALAAWMKSRGSISE